MTVLTASSPVMETIVWLLQDAALQSAVGGRLGDDIADNTPRPLVWIEILTETNIGGFGPGHMPEIEFRTHTFSDIGSMSEAQSINKSIVNLLIDQKDLTITGFQQAGEIVYHQSVALRDQELQGVKVHEVVSEFTIRAQQ